MNSTLVGTNQDELAMHAWLPALACDGLTINVPIIRFGEILTFLRRTGMGLNMMWNVDVEKTLRFHIWMDL